MKKGFSILNIIIFVGSLSLGYMIVSKYYFTLTVPEETLTDSQDVATSKTVTSSSVDQVENISTQNEKETKVEQVASPLPDVSTLPIRSALSFATTDNTTNDQAPAHNGKYVNEDYGYILSFPPLWRLKDQYSDDIYIGTIPPKNGQGAINISLESSPQAEINQLKKEVQKYSGMMSLSEKMITIDGVLGTELTLDNSISGSKDVYIIIEHSGNGFVIKYSHESDSFVSEVNEVLQKFKFMEK